MLVPLRLGILSFTSPRSAEPCSSLESLSLSVEIRKPHGKHPDGGVV